MKPSHILIGGIWLGGAMLSLQGHLTGDIGHSMAGSALLLWAAFSWVIYTILDSEG